MKRMVVFLAAGFLLGTLALAEESKPLVVRASRIHTGDGTVIDGGAILIQNGKIVQVGGAIDVDGADSIESESAVVTPGLIDAASTAGVIDKRSWAEHSSEVVPHLRVLDAIDLASRDFERLVREGVTTVYVTPDSGNVIGARGCVVKTGGPEAGRVVVPELGVKATLGRDSYRRGAYNRGPSGREASIVTRRPTTRMGVTAVLQDAFYAAMKGAAAGGAAAAAPPADPALATLAEVLEGKIPLRFQARKAHDIWSAIRFAREFGVGFVLEEAIEAYRCIPELKAAGAPVIFGPVYVDPSGYLRYTGEADRPCLNTAGLLVEAGLTVALTAGDLEGEGSLPHQAGFAMRAGLSFDAALAAVTAAPARILGIEGRLGTLAPGMDADLVVWNGDPFAPTARPIAVVVGGRPVYVLGLTGADAKLLTRAEGAGASASEGLTQ